MKRDMTRRAGSIADCVADRARDSDLEPIRVGPPEPPGPPPKRKLTDAGRRFVVGVIVAVAVLALCVLVARFGDYPG